MRSVGHQAAIRDADAVDIDGRQLIAGDSLFNGKGLLWKERDAAGEGSSGLARLSKLLGG
jgi:hypothetical protein